MGAPYLTISWLARLGRDVVYRPRLVSASLEIVFLDADDTVVRSVGSKRMPISAVVERARH